MCGRPKAALLFYAVKGQELFLIVRRARNILRFRQYEQRKHRALFVPSVFLLRHLHFLQKNGIL